jgi:hypothetical protein
MEYSRRSNTLTPESFNSVGWLGWLRLFAVLSLDLIDEEPVCLWQPVVRAESMKTFLRAQIKEHELLYCFRDYAPGSNSGPFRAKTSEFAAAIFDRVSQMFGSQGSRSLLKWCVLVRGELEGSNWDWFAYKAAVSLWAGQYMNRRVDIFELGSTSEWLKTKFVELCYEPDRRFDLAIPALRSKVLSAWDAYCLRVSWLSLSSEEPDPWNDLVEYLRVTLGMSRFQTLWQEFAGSAPREVQVLMHARVLPLLSRNGIPYPAGRKLPFPWELID